MKRAATVGVRDFDRPVPGPVPTEKSTRGSRHVTHRPRFPTVTVQPRVLIAFAPRYFLKVEHSRKYERRHR